MLGGALQGELYAGTNFVSPSALDKIESLPTLLEVDDVSTKDELSKAIMEISSSRLKCSNAVEASCVMFFISCSAGAGRRGLSHRR